MNYTNHNSALRNPEPFDRSASLRVLCKNHPVAPTPENIRSRLQASWPYITINVSANETDTTDRNGDTATTNTFDAANRLTSVTDTNGFIISYGYDEAGNVTSLTYPGNKTVTYTYDALNRLKTVTNWLSQTASYTYDDAGRLTQLINFNGSITDYGYDNANRLISLNNQTSTSSTIASYQRGRLG